MGRAKKKTPTKRVRRSPYERSLEHATRRLDKAIAEQMQAQSDLAALAIEIPRLQGIIRALTPDGELTKRVDRRIGGHVVNDQSEFLKRFVKPIESPTLRGTQPTTIITEEVDEEFIPPTLPGQELLP